MAQLPPEAYLVVEILFSILLISVIVFISIYARHLTIQKKLLTRQSEKRKGTLTILKDRIIEKTGNEIIFEKRRRAILVQFTAFNQPIEVIFNPGNNKSEWVETWVWIKLKQSISTKFVIEHKSFINRYSKAYDNPELKNMNIDNEEFNHAYKIWSDNELVTRSLLDSKIQNALLEMKHKKPHVQIYENALGVYYTLQFLTTDKEYDQLIDISLLLLQRINEIF